MVCIPLCLKFNFRQQQETPQTQQILEADQTPDMCSLTLGCP